MQSPVWGTPHIPRRIPQVSDELPSARVLTSSTWRILSAHLLLFTLWPFAPHQKSLRSRQGSLKEKVAFQPSSYRDGELTDPGT
jgi:hypothetical protein